MRVPNRETRSGPPRWPTRWIKEINPTPEVSRARDRLQTAGEPLSSAARQRVWLEIYRRVGAQAAHPKGRWWWPAIVGPLAGAVAVALVVLSRSQSVGPDGASVERDLATAQVSGDARVRMDGSWIALGQGGDGRVSLPARLALESGAHASMLLPHGVSLDFVGAAEADMVARSVVLDFGEALVSVEPGHGTFYVDVGEFRVVVKGTRFWVARGASEATVCLLEGRVDVTRGRETVVSLAPGAAWRSSPQAPALRGDLQCALVGTEPIEPPEPVVAPPVMPQAPQATGEPGSVTRKIGVTASGTARAPGAVQSSTSPVAAPAPPVPRIMINDQEPGGRCAQTVDVERCYRERASGDTLDAQNALYSLGRLLLARGSTTQALEAWREYRGRFPDGVLRPEVDLSALEVRLKIGDETLAFEEAETFLTRHAQDERAAEVHAIKGVLLHRRGDCAAALVSYEQALRGKLSDERRKEIWAGTAACLESLSKWVEP